MAESQDEFNFEDWATENGLSRRTSKYLRDEELTTPKLISLITEKDLVMFPLPLGQKKTIQAAIDAFQDATGTPPRPSPDVTAASEVLGSAETAEENATAADAVNMDNLRLTKDILDGGKTFDELLNLTSRQPEYVSKPAFTQFDPRAILTVKASQRKALHITDFLSERTKKRRQSRRRGLVLTASDSDKDRLVLKSDDDHPYSGIRMDEWGAANCRVMNALIGKQLLSRGDVEYYLAYTARIFEFAAKYDFESVLDYDHQYRELQAEHEFQWGTTSPDMELRILVDKQNAARGPRRYRDQEPWAPQGVKNTGQTGIHVQECKLFKARGYCPFGDKCRYSHPTTSANIRSTPASGPGTYQPPKNGQ